MYQKSMFGRYYCIGHVLTSNNVENVLERSFSLVSRMAPMFTLLGDVLITPLTGHTQMSQLCHKIMFATLCVLYGDVKFCDGPGILHAKSCIHVLTPHELPLTIKNFRLNMAVNSV